MGKRNNEIQKSAFNYGEHRHTYLSKLQECIQDARKNINVLDIEVHVRLVLRFFCHLQNWGIYKSNNVMEVYNYFIKNDPYFVEGLRKYLEENRRHVYRAMYNIYQAVQNYQNSNINTFYSEFLDDLMVIAGIKAKSNYFFWLEPTYNSEKEYEKTQEYINKWHEEKQIASKSKSLNRNKEFN